MLFSFFPKSKRKQKEIPTNNNNNECINIIKDKIKEEANNFCIECGEKHPQYISINNSIFLCKECILNHLQLSQEVSTIIKNDLKILTLNEVQYIIQGGNQKLLDFVNNEYPDLNQLEPQIFYNTKAMDYYRKRLKYLTEGGEEPKKPSKKDAYNLIKKIEETDISDIDMDPDEHYEELNNDNTDKNNENENTKRNSMTNTKSKCEENSNELQNKKNNSTLSNEIKKKCKSNIYNKNNDKDNNKSNSNYEHYNNISRISKNIKFKKNYNNFDNEKYNSNTNKTSDTIEISNINFKNLKNNISKDNIYLKNEIFSPQPNKNEMPDNNIISNIYFKPKISNNKNYNYRTKSDYSNKNPNNNEINIVFNINEFNIENKKKKLDK